MTVVIFAAPYVPPAPDVPLFKSISHTWTGWDGSVWNMGDVAGGVIFVAGGLRGMSMPTFDRYSSSSPALAGSRFRGSRTQERAIEWAVLVWSDQSSQAWADRDKAFWKTMDPEKPGIWSVELPDGQKRELTCRFTGDGGHTYARDPARRGWELYQPQLIAENPYWRGETIPRAWSGATPVDFFDAAGGPPFHISDAANFGSATLPNPGNVDAWATWSAHGPLGPILIECAGGLIALPAVPEGSTLIADTDPRTASVELDGVDVMDAVSAWDPRPIPAGSGTPIAFTATGSGRIAAQITARHFRAI